MLALESSLIVTRQHHSRQEFEHFEPSLKAVSRTNCDQLTQSRNRLHERKDSPKPPTPTA